MQRERWGSRLLFIFAAVGSAAGLGNLWRFPYLAFKHGGAAFLLPYLVILLLIGVPLLLLEFAIGQRFQKGAVEGMYGLNKNFSGVGFMGICNGFVITTYYTVVIAWVVLFFVNSFNVAWSGNETSFFYEKILNISSNINHIGFPQIPIFLGLIVVWIAIYFSIWKGAKSASKVVMVTMPLPIILVIILAIKGITLGKGSSIGISAYIIPNAEDLKSFINIFLDPKVWNAAISQIFFTLTLGFGTMIAYGSYNDTKQELVKSTYWTVFLNSAISIIAGFAVFGTIGYMSYNLAVEKNVPYKMVAEYQKANNIQVVRELNEKEAKNKTYTYEELKTKGINISKKEVARYNLKNSKLDGPGLAFVVYPKAIAMFKPKWVAAVFGMLFFIMLFTLGIDSAFSLVEAISTVIADELHRKSQIVNRSFIALLVCIIAFLFGIIFTTRGGLYILDIVDHYINGYGLVIVGLMQAIVAGWLYKTTKLKDYINSTTNIKVGFWWVFSIKFIAPFFLSLLLIQQLIIDIKTPYGNYPVLIQLIIIGIILIIPIFTSIFISTYLKMQKE